MKPHAITVPVPNPTTAKMDPSEVWKGPVRCEDCGSEAVGIEALFEIECTAPSDVVLVARRGDWMRIDCGRCRAPGQWIWMPESWMEKCFTGFPTRCTDCLDHESDA